MRKTLKRSTSKPAPVARQKQEKEELHFDPWLAPGSPRLHEASLKAVQALLKAEPPRERARRESAQKALEAIVGAVVANLLYRRLEHGKPGPIIIALGKRSSALLRYDRKAFDKLPEAVNALTKAKWLKLRKAKQGKRGKASTVSIGPAMESALGDLRVTWTDFRRVAGEETIIINRKAAGYKNKVRPDGSYGPVYDRAHSERVDYRDTGHTKQLRAQLQAINDWIAKADLRFTGRGLSVDTSQRLLKRYFLLPPRTDVEDFKFDSGGRLFGGWWQNLKSAQRKHIRIEGEPVADLDFSGMFVRLALLSVGERMESDLDPYAIPGLGREHRDAVKIVVATMLFAEAPRKQYPKDMKEPLRDAMPFKKVRQMILAHVPKSEEIFERGLGHSLFLAESSILLGCLERLQLQGIVALPMHDGLMVASSRAKEAMGIMSKTSKDHLGVELPVKRKS